MNRKERRASDKANKGPVRYELPELSERFGYFVTALDLATAKAIAEEHGVAAIWKVSGIIPLFAGKIWSLVDGRWGLVPSDYRCCSCAECAAGAPTKH